MFVTYYAALPFVRSEDGSASGQAQECPNEQSAIRRAEALARDPANVGALAFKRSGDTTRAFSVFGSRADGVVRECPLRGRSRRTVRKAGVIRTDGGGRGNGGPGPASSAGDARRYAAGPDNRGQLYSMGSPSDLQDQT